VDGGSFVVSLVVVEYPKSNAFDPSLPRSLSAAAASNQCCHSNEGIYRNNDPLSDPPPDDDEDERMRASAQTGSATKRTRTSVHAKLASGFGSHPKFLATSATVVMISSTTRQRTKRKGML
jgi:hypothetical protein